MLFLLVPCFQVLQKGLIDALYAQKFHSFLAILVDFVDDIVVGGINNLHSLLLPHDICLQAFGEHFICEFQETVLVARAAE